MCLQTGAKPLAARTKRTAPEEGVPLPILRTRENMETVPQSDRQPQGRQSTAGAQRKSPPGHATLRLSLEEALMKESLPQIRVPNSVGEERADPVEDTAWIWGRVLWNHTRKRYKCDLWN